MFKIFLTNLGKYVEGELVGEWLKLPATPEEIEACKKRIGIGSRYEETFITDYENNFGYSVGEYENLETLNETAERLEALEPEEIEVMKAYFKHFSNDFEEALDKIESGSYTFWDAESMEDIAIQLMEEEINRIPEEYQIYFDYEAYGRDLEINGNFERTENGYIEFY